MKLLPHAISQRERGWSSAALEWTLSIFGAFLLHISKKAQGFPHYAHFKVSLIHLPWTSSPECESFDFQIVSKSWNGGTEVKSQQKGKGVSTTLANTVDNLYLVFVHFDFKMYVIYEFAIVLSRKLFSAKDCVYPDL